MHIEAPKNRHASNNEVLSGNNAVLPCSHHPKAPPSTNGATIPAAETARELVKRLRIISIRNSIPTTNMYNAKPNCDAGNK
ncbi:MAG: hypothetical protein RIS92_1395 [Verrucomicrobiota bacterium]|jgi:hypothetical protein